jgi:hypothetical protein
MEWNGKAVSYEILISFVLSQEIGTPTKQSEIVVLLIHYFNILLSIVVKYLM